jgi:4'-phosphopantetheinyl transferase EntD
MTSTSSLENELDRALEALAPPDVQVGVLAIDPRHVDALLPVEQAHIRGAIASRQHEFATGRVLLRQLLGTSTEIPVLPSRAPALPMGIVGSLAHDHDVAIAAVAPAPPRRGLGIDLEATGWMAADEAALVLGDHEGHLDPRLAFVLKEATYKAWAGLGGGPLDFHDVRLKVEVDRWSAVVTTTDLELGGRWTEVGSRYVALAVA